MEGFDVLRVLGAGSFGRALLCRDEDRELVVVKEIGPLADAKALREAEREADLLKAHSHTNIVKYIASFCDASKRMYYLVCEYCDGGDLSGSIARRRVRREPWHEDDAMMILVQILLALRHVHQRRVVHRDVKSGNIFLTTHGVVKLGDFGVSRRLAVGEEHKTELALTQVGTPYYLSPEIFEGKRYGRKSDVWSLGVVAYEVLALRMPFEANSLAALCRRVTSDVYAVPPLPKSHRYSCDLEIFVCHQLLERNPERRPSADELASNSPYVRRHMRNALSHTVEGGPLALSKDAAIPVDKVMQAQNDSVPKHVGAKEDRCAQAQLEPRPEWQTVGHDDDCSKPRDNEEEWVAPPPIGAGVHFPAALVEEYAQRRLQERRNRERALGLIASPARPPSQEARHIRVTAGDHPNKAALQMAQRQFHENKAKAHEVARRVLEDIHDPREPEVTAREASAASVLASARQAKERERRRHEELLQAERAHLCEERKRRAEQASANSQRRNFCNLVLEFDMRVDAASKCKRRPRRFQQPSERMPQTVVQAQPPAKSPPGGTSYREGEPPRHRRRRRRWGELPVKHIQCSGQVYKEGESDKITAVLDEMWQAVAEVPAARPAQPPNRSFKPVQHVAAENSLQPSYMRKNQVVALNAALADALNSPPADDTADDSDLGSP